MFPFSGRSGQTVSREVHKGRQTPGCLGRVSGDDLHGLDFAYEGVTGRGCRVKYREMIAAHRQEVKNGEFTSGVREGMDDATHEALNTCMQEEDEAEENGAKSKGEKAAIEKAKQEQAEKVCFCCET